MSLLSPSDCICSRLPVSKSGTGIRRLSIRARVDCIEKALGRALPTKPFGKGLLKTCKAWKTTRAASEPGSTSGERRPRPSSSRKDSGGFDFQEVLRSDLPGKLGVLLGLIVLTRVGVYVRLPGVDVEKFAQTISQGGLLGYIDALAGGSISRVGIFSLGIVPYINASIMLQLLSTAFPSLKKLQREEGKQGKDRFKLYTRLVALAFALVQAVGQLTFIRPFVDDFSPLWLLGSTALLTGGAMALVFVADYMTELKLGNGTSILIFTNIASSLPTSVGAVLTQSGVNKADLTLYFVAVFLTTLGIVYVQEAERKIPINYASRYRAGALARQSYLPFKVNATGVMPVIFASSLVAAPTALARLSGNLELQQTITRLLSPTGALYLPVEVALIVFFNWYYTFLQLEPKDVADQLKRGGASIPGIRPGRATAEYITTSLGRLSALGSAFLGALAVAPAAVEAITGLQAFRGFAGTSVLILVGVATDTARKFRAELAMAKYKDFDDKLYDDVQ